MFLIQAVHPEDLQGDHREVQPVGHQQAEVRRVVVHHEGLLQEGRHEAHPGDLQEVRKLSLLVGMITHFVLTGPQISAPPPGRGPPPGGGPPRGNEFYNHHNNIVSIFTVVYYRAIWNAPSRKGSTPTSRGGRWPTARFDIALDDDSTHTINSAFLT